jgi:glycosyltransferase involved in cell wall biosynthesis
MTKKNTPQKLINGKMPLVSIVTPAYNQAQFLRETVESVLTQDYPRIEYRVIDDGSTDDTPRILEEYTGRILWETHANRGQTATINKGWDSSTGEILTWLNSDDTLLPGAVRTAVEYLERHPDVGIVFGDTLFTEADGKPLNRTGPLVGFDYRDFVRRCENPIPQPSAFLRRWVIERTGPLDPYFRYFMDWDYWLRAGLCCKIAYIPEVLSTYRLHPQSNTVAQSARVAPELAYMYQKYFAREDLPADLRAMRRTAMASMHFTTAGYYSKGGAWGKAARSGLQAVAADPTGIARPRSLHQLAYCLAGWSPIYTGLRRAVRRAPR